MTKLCPRGKAAAKRKFKVYPSAYANAYASRICAGKIKDPSGVKRKDFKGRKPAMGGGSMNTRIGLKFGTKPSETKMQEKKFDLKKAEDFIKKMKSFRKTKAGGGLMEATARLQRQGLRGGGICKKGMNRKAVGKNS